jgi:hypothetical protein
MLLVKRPALNAVTNCGAAALKANSCRLLLLLLLVLVLPLLPPPSPLH